MFTNKPKLLGEPTALNTRLKQLEVPHIAPLTAFVHELRDIMGPDASIPYFDPWDGGLDSEVLFLLEAPGPKARNSGFISRNNPDETAKNLLELLPPVRGVVLVGGKAQKAENHIRKISSSFAIHICPHPSPIFVNRLRGNRQILLEQLQAVQAFLEQD